MLIEPEKKLTPLPIVILISGAICFALVFCITEIGMTIVYLKRKWLSEIRDDLTKVEQWKNYCKYPKWTAFFLCLLGTILAIYQSSIGGWLVASSMILGGISEVVKKKLQKHKKKLRGNSSLLNANISEANSLENIELLEGTNSRITEV